MVFWEITGALCICLLIFAVVSYLWDRLAGCAGTDNCRISLVLYARGSGSELEHAVKALGRLRSRLAPGARILIVDAGLESDALVTVRILAASCDNIILCPVSEAGHILEDGKWKPTERRAPSRDAS